MLSAWAVVLCAQEIPRIRAFSPQDYGSQNQNWSLAQNDSTGWLYVGNNGGLLEFDGSRWRQFYLPDKQIVRAVATGRDGMVFCGGYASFGFWKTDDAGRLRYTALSDLLPADSIGGEEIWHILVTRDFVLFQSFSALFKYDYQRVTRVASPGSVMFAAAVHGTVLLPVIGRGLYELQADDTFRPKPGCAALGDKIVQFIVPGPNGKTWIGTAGDGLFELDEKGCRPWPNPLNEKFRLDQVNKAIPLRSGGWAVGTILNGVYILDGEGRLRFHINRENGLQNNTVLALLEDRDGNVWAGLDRGIDLIALRSPLTFFVDQTGKIGAVYTAARWNGVLYIGTNHGVFARRLSRAATEGFRLLKGTQGQVWQLKVFDDQLLCGHNSGTFLINAKGEARKISDTTGGWHTLPVPGDSRRLIQATYTGLIVFEKNKGGVWQFARRIGGWRQPLRRLAFDRDGYLWAAHANKGVVRLRLDEKLTEASEVKIFTHSNGFEPDAGADLVTIGNDLIFNTLSYPLLQTGTAEHPRFAPLTTRVEKRLPAYSGGYFSSDSSGVSLCSGSVAYPLGFSLIPQYENIVAMDSNLYLFCRENGYALLEWSSLRQLATPRPLQAVIRYLEDNRGRRFLPAEGQVFPWNQNSLKFYFAAPVFERAPLFSWQLESLSAGWSSWSANPEKEFINLPAGRHVFRLRSDTGSETKLVFYIQPAWYATPWAILGYIACFMALLFFIEYLNRRRLARQALHLEAEKTKELARQRAEAEREKLALEVEGKSRELSNAALNLVRKNEVLQHLKEALSAAKNDGRSLDKIIRLIDSHLESDHDWGIFEESFNSLHDDFFKRLIQQYPGLRPGDLRLAAFLKMNLSSKEIAQLLNMSIRGMENKRYRLRKKLGLEEDANLTEFMMRF